MGTKPGDERRRAPTKSTLTNDLKRDFVRVNSTVANLVQKHLARLLLNSLKRGSKVKGYGVANSVEMHPALLPFALAHRIWTEYKWLRALEMSVQ